MARWDFEPAKDLGLDPLKRMKHERREAGLLEYLTQFGARCFVKSYMTLWHRVEVEQSHNVPRETPFVLCANHASHLDSVVLGSVVPWSVRRNTFPLAAGDVFFETPVLTALAAFCINALPMWRKNVGRHALDALRARLVEERCGYILFPEGKRSDDGTLLPFKAGVGMMVAGTDIPVIPAYIHGAYDALPKAALVPRPRKLRVTVGEPLHFRETSNDVEGWRTVAASVREAVRELGGVKE
ncbi:MAG: lysophospholipid acyltransferase family protein [Phycisphaerales bacterium]